ncbi:hypothetical protein [Azospirillum melinis]
MPIPQGWRGRPRLERGGVERSENLSEWMFPSICRGVGRPVPRPGSPTATFTV